MESKAGSKFSLFRASYRKTSHPRVVRSSSASCGSAPLKSPGACFFRKHSRHPGARRRRVFLPSSDVCSNGPVLPVGFIGQFYGSRSIVNVSRASAGLPAAHDRAGLKGIEFEPTALPAGALSWAPQRRRRLWGRRLMLPSGASPAAGAGSAAAITGSRGF